MTAHALLRLGLVVGKAATGTRDHLIEAGVVMDTTARVPLLQGVTEKP